MKSENNFYALTALIIVIFIDSLGFGLIFPILSPLFLSHTAGILPASAPEGIRDLDYGLVLLIFSAVMFFTAPVLGDISDQIGRKKVLLFSLLGSGFSSLVCAIAIVFKSFAFLLVGRILAGLAAGSQTSAQAAIADISSGKNRVKNLGLISAAGSAGFIFGPIIGGVFSDSALVSWFNFSTPFYLDAIVATLNTILLYFAFKETYQGTGKIKFNILKAVTIFNQAFQHASLRLLSIILLLLEITFALYIQFISLYLVSNFDFKSSTLGLFMSFSGLIFALTLGVIMRFVIRVTNEKTIIFIGLLFSIIGYLLPVFIDTAWMQWLSLIPIIVGIGMAYNALLAGFSHSVSENEQGWVMGITTAVMAMSWILGALSASLFFYLNPKLPYVMAAVFLLFAVFTTCFVNGKQIRHQSS